MSREFKAHTTPPMPPIVDPPPTSPLVDPRRPPMGDPLPQPEDPVPVPPAPQPVATRGEPVPNRPWVRRALVRVHRKRWVH